MKLKDILDNTKMVSVTTPHSVISFIEEGLLHEDTGEFISDNTLCFELSPKTLLVTDLERNYLFVYHCYCSDEFCFLQ